jgi:hypothetical protein
MQASILKLYSVDLSAVNAVKKLLKDFFLSYRRLFDDGSSTANNLDTTREFQRKMTVYTNAGGSFLKE